MLRDRPDAKTLLELLDFHPRNWREYYDELFARFPALAARWINVDLWNMPRDDVANTSTLARQARRLQETTAREHRDALMLAELRALAMAVTARRGRARAQALRRLDRRLADYGLRPQHPGGSRISTSERSNIRAHYNELREVIDEVRSAECEGHGDDYRLAIFIKFPFFTTEEMALIYAHPYSRRGATSDAALAVLAGRLSMSPASLNRYLFPRRRTRK
jgi:hypothetical protein